MAGLVAGTHALAAKKGLDGWDQPGHDEAGSVNNNR
jgi:hypothetical protein